MSEQSESEHQKSKIVLASRSPRRRELLGHLISPDRIEIVPPTSAEELGFEGLTTWRSIEDRMVEIASDKLHDTMSQLAGRKHNVATSDRDAAIAAVIAADTVIVAGEESEGLIVLGQPPADDQYAATVRRWFLEYYAGQVHFASTALVVATSDNRSVQRLCRSSVTMTHDVERWLDWYIETGEPRGKAGGYALQGAGSLFVSHVEGSVSNVVGLPLRELLECFEELQIDVG